MCVGVGVRERERKRERERERERERDEHSDFLPRQHLIQKWRISSFAKSNVRRMSLPCCAENVLPLLRYSLSDMYLMLFMLLKLSKK